MLLRLLLCALLLAGIAFFSVGCDRANAEVASFYGYELAGQPTANGTPYNPEGFTAAHLVYPFGTQLIVCHHSCVRVVVTDRGPHVPGRDLDLSLGAARAIGLTEAGVAPVTVQAIP